MGNSTSSTNTTDQEYLKENMLKSLSDTEISNIMTTIIKNKQVCSSAIENNVSIGSSSTFRNVSGPVVINFGDTVVDQSISLNLKCLADNKVFNQMINDVSTKMVNDLKGITEDNINSILNNKTSSELGSISGTSSTTNTKIKTTEIINNTIVNKIKNIVANNLNFESYKECVSKATNNFDKGSKQNVNTANNGVYLDYGKTDVKQSITSVIECIFSDEIKNSIVNTISNDLFAKSDTVSKTTTTVNQSSETEAKGIGSLYKSIFDGVGGVMTSSIGIFIVIGIVIIAGLLYMAFGGGNDLAKNVIDKNPQTAIAKSVLK